MTAVVSGADRKPPALDADNIALRTSYVAYTGKYTIEGDKWTTKVDVSWNEVYSTQDQVQFFRAFPEKIESGFPWRREYDSSCLLAGGQHGWRSHIRRTCVDV